MSINAVKGVEMGSGFGLSALPGHFAQVMNADRGKWRSSVPVQSIMAACWAVISTGQDIVARVAIKPTSLYSNAPKIHR